MFSLIIGLILLALSFGYESNSLTPNLLVPEIAENISLENIISLTPTPLKLFANNSSNTESASEENENFDNTQNIIPAYNTKSEKYIGEVPSVAVENSPSLVPCSDNPELCDSEVYNLPTLTPSPTPNPTATIEITLTPISPTPKIEPIPTLCPDSEIVCPMYMCLEVHTLEKINGCGCSCNPVIL